VDDDTLEDEGLRARLTKQGEDAIGKLAQDLLENPLISGAIGRAFEAREKAAQAQEVAMGALNLPSAADVERLTRRLRSVSQRLEGIEDSVDRVEERISTLGSHSVIDERLRGIEERLDVISGELSALRSALPDDAEPVPRAQERLEVGKAD
jgi:CRP-like cAMP-binding protein